MSEPQKGLKSLKVQFALGLGLGVAVMLAVALFGDVDAVVEEAKRIEPRYLIAACALSLVNYCLRFAKWHFYLGRLGLEVPLGESFLTFMSGLSMSVTPGKLGEFLKSLMLRASRGIPIANTSPVVVAERATDAFGLLVLMAIGSLSFAYGKPAIVTLTGVSIAFVLLIQQRGLVGGLLDRMGRLHRLKPLIPSIRVFYDASYRLFLPLSLTTATLMSAVSWSMEGFAFYLVLLGLGVHLTLFKTIFIFSFSTLLGAVSMLPGGLGAADASLLGLLTLEGMTKARAGSAALIIRLATLWLAVLVGMAALAISARMGLLRGGLGALRDAARVDSEPEAVTSKGRTPPRPEPTGSAASAKTD